MRAARRQGKTFFIATKTQRPKKRIVIISFVSWRLCGRFFLVPRQNREFGRKEKVVRRADIIGGMITILFGAIAITQSVQLEYWSPFGPGPGFVPLWCSIFIVFGGILLLLQALRKRRTSVQPVSAAKMKRLAIVASVAALTVIAAILMDFIGFTVSMFLFMVTMVGFVGKHRWYVVLATGVSVAISFYFVFGKWLQVPLPKGIVGF